VTLLKLNSGLQLLFAMPAVTFPASALPHSASTSIYYSVNRGICVNDLPKVAAWQRNGYGFNLRALHVCHLYHLLDLLYRHNKLF